MTDNPRPNPRTIGLRSIAVSRRYSPTMSERSPALTDQPSPIANAPAFYVPRRAEWVAWLRSRTGILAALIVVGLASRVAMWATGRIWEDALITTTHARTFVDGLGLTHHAGEPPTYGFTSALSVLMAIPGELMAVGGGVTATRIASLVAVVIALAFARRLADLLGLSTAATGFVIAFLALDQLQVFYGMVGMETQVAVAIILVSAYYVVREDIWKAGLSLGVAVLARPDFLIWVGVALIWLFVRSKSGAIRAAVAGATVLVPWIAFTTLYYGSPIPQTIQAKAVVYAAYPQGIFDIPAWFAELTVCMHKPARACTTRPQQRGGHQPRAPPPAGRAPARAHYRWRRRHTHRD